MKKSIVKIDYPFEFTFKVTIDALSDVGRERARLHKALSYTIRTGLTDDFKVKLTRVERRPKEP
jgi:hypothetical protein